MEIKAIKTRIFREKEDLLSFISEYLKKIPEKSVLVVTSKIVALSEGRTEEIDPSLPHALVRERIIRKESDFMLRTEHAWLTIKDGMIMASAGIDESNANGKIILLPKNSFKTAEIIRKQLVKKFNLKNLGILITDSRLFPLRAGIVGAALGYAGFKGVRDYRKSSDIFGRIMKISRTDVADSLATAAVLCMGEGKEQKPLAIITNAPIIFTKKINRKELLMNTKEDIYAPLVTKFN